MSKPEFCRNCGKKSGVFTLFALPGLCMDCYKLPVIWYHYNTDTGQREKHMTPLVSAVEMLVAQGFTLSEVVTIWNDVVEGKA